MFSHLNEQPKDKILALMAAYKEDPRDTKVDLGVGVYKIAKGQTPVMRAVKAAEEAQYVVAQALHAERNPINPGKGKLGEFGCFYRTGIGFQRYFDFGFETPEAFGLV